LDEANDMSHDAAWTKDATKKPPDRGGRSFLRTGSFPSLARMRARWAAFSLAAAVLLCGRRVLADDGVRVHIDSPVFVELAECESRYHSLTRPPNDPPTTCRHTRLVCVSPCDDVITGVYDRYVITGAFPNASAFSLPAVTGGVTITVQPGSENHRRRMAGLGAAIGGGIGFFLPGLLMLTLGSTYGEKAVWGPGIGFMAIGGATAIIGGVLLATSGTNTKIKLQKTSVGPVGSAAKVKPRYWMGEF
jgi:hypothetical protein